MQLQPWFRTGVGPLMAIGLLLSEPPPLYKYRHDLGSLFYTFVCAAATFDPNCEQKISVIEAWNSHDLDLVGFLKRQFLMGTAGFDAAFEPVRADFKSPIAGYLYDLWMLFGDAALLSFGIQNLKRR